MKPNAYILDWTMNEYSRLLAQLKEQGFDFQKEEGEEHVRVDVPFFRWEEFANLVQPQLNAPYNYVDIKYPEENKLIIIFGAKRFVITNKEENEAAKKWAIDSGLPTAQADWSNWFK
ncbi:MAG: hypothetical protein Q8P68_03895 [Candidatus Peregrinibacteria bacterium]|nr:hypothetical protein [Candidatus Peregrinibacteria bacterium]MDZ4245442.1 hypothetical protein [Candidatus Gracilibacteria bacterium]